MQSADYADIVFGKQKDSLVNIDYRNSNADSEQLDREKLGFSSDINITDVENWKNGLNLLLLSN